MNYVRFWYNDLLANLVDSDCLQFLLDQVSYFPLEVDPEIRLRKQIAEEVRKADYALC